MLTKASKYIEEINYRKDEVLSVRIRESKSHTGVTTYTGTARQERKQVVNPDKVKE